ncbi:atrophin-1-like [Drosophila kikkawai]|uniref:Atrophin-1-like n=1 Tax=Drosophila kikkawai TaxID=30033 RepID=A0ABM4GGX2_DROKI
MEPIIIDSSDEENVAPNGHDGRPATPRDPRMRPGTFYAGRPTRACPTGIRQTRGPPRAPSPPMRPTASRAPPRRATPRPMSESSDESPPTSPPRRAAPPTPPRPSRRSISPFYVDSTGRRIPCSEAPPARLDFLNPGYTGPYRGSQNPDAPGHSRWYPNPGTPGHYQGTQNPAASVPPARERYSPCSPRQQGPEPDEDDEEEGSLTSSPPASPRDSDATPPYSGYHGEGASEQDDDDAQTISSDSEPDGDAPSAAHFIWEGEDRCGYWRGSWIQLIHTHYTSILIEAPFRPTPDPIVTFPPSLERLCVMAPDEDWEMDMGNTPEVRPPSPALGEDAALPIFPGDRADANAPLASTSQHAPHITDETYDNAPLASTSQGSIHTADDPDEHGYQPTGKAMQWESESSDSETETGQRFRRKEVRPRPPPDVGAPSHQPSAHRRVMSTERNTPPNAAETIRRASTHSRATIDGEVTPPTTPRVDPGDRGFDLSPGTLDVLMEELEPAVEGLLQELIPDWDLNAPSTAPAQATAADEVPPPAPRFPRQVPAGDYFTTDDPMPARVAIPAAWWTNTPDRRVPLTVWQEIERRSYAARYSRQRFRVRTQEGPYQVTMKTSGEVQIRFGSA